jgi:hypothetical protein
MSAADLKKAAKLLYGKFDPDGQFTGDINIRNLAQHGIQNLRFQSRTMDARAQGLLSTQQLEALRGSDETKNFQALQKMYAGEYDFSSAGLGKFTDRSMRTY